jgi:hypothetical protein
MQGLIEAGALDELVCTITAAPSATWGALSLAVALSALTASAAAVARAGGRGVLLTGIALGAIAMAAVASVHWLLDLHAIFGLYEPRFAAREGLVAPLMNPNHLAAHMALGWPVCLALAARSGERASKRLGWASGALLVGLVGLFTLSRGGAAAMIGGGAAFALLASLHASRRGLSTRRTLTILGTTLTLGSAAIFVSANALLEELDNSDHLDKLLFLGDVSRLVEQHPLVGVGRGAFGDVSARVILSNSRILYAESLPLQWAAEWGIPCATVLALSLMASLVQVRIESTRDIGVLCGLGALAAQNLVDFSLELAGVATVAALAFGVLLGSADSLRWPIPPLRATQRVLTGALLFAIPATWSSFTHESRDGLAHELERAASGSAPTLDAQLLRRAFRAFPVEPAFTLHGATMAERSRSADARRWINLAMRMAPGWAGPHLLAAEHFERLGVLTQAALELGLATDVDPTAPNLACQFLQRHPSPDLALAAVATPPERREGSFAHLAGCLPSESRADFIASALEEFSASLPLLRMHAALAPSVGERVARAQRFFAAAPTSPDAFVALGDALLAAQRDRDVLALIERAPEPLRTSPFVLRLEVRAAASANDGERLKRGIENLLTAAGAAVTDRIRAHELASLSLEQTGNPLAALAHAQKAYESGGRADNLERVHKLALRAGQLPLALRAASELCHIRHRGGAYCGSKATRDE